ncbi:hypothetical protein [Photobacterium galatheae]|uniref:Recombination-associated protein RdgC n=1 Tax=Photobacterium galatheae TaxID=1654360 RepID=A0A066RKH5_9GAMM|nr:hypothetical protein [Photobacterium galatheae]KDM90839.1 hypothetical protein EA58_13850 [Photobacterium galatheae]MCM0149193.1 hypothetical protein [Photobacterium galatheae]
MKKFVLYQFFGKELSNEILTGFIDEKAYVLDEFNLTEDYRCGFSTIHQKLDHLFVDGNGFVKTRFKMATRTINKTMLADLVRKKVKENREKGIEVQVGDIEFSLQLKLRETADIKISVFDVIFDTKNHLIYASASDKVFEEKFLPFLKVTFPELKVRAFGTQHTPESMAEFFTAPQSLPEGIQPSHFVKVEKEDGSIVTFDEAELNAQPEFKAILEEGNFFVNQVSMKISQEAWVCDFKINNKSLPTGIRVEGCEQDAEMERAAGLSGTASEARDRALTKEQVLFDRLYTNTRIEIEALAQIAAFVFDFKAMEKKIECANHS